MNGDMLLYENEPLYLKEGTHQTIPPQSQKNGTSNAPLKRVRPKPKPSASAVGSLGTISEEPIPIVHDMREGAHMMPRNSGDKKTRNSGDREKSPDAIPRL